MMLTGGNVQTRLLSCIVGGLVGAVLASPANNLLALHPAVALIACSFAGVAVGYMVSILIDVFGGDHSQIGSPK
jgi:hypothetical protein